jgi:NADH-quinone oxidoreductase subunit H
MMVCLKYFLPISCGLLIGVSIWELYLPRSAAAVVPYILAGGSILFGLVVFARLLVSNAFAPSINVGGAWQLPAAKGGA